MRAVSSSTPDELWSDREERVDTGIGSMSCSCSLVGHWAVGVGSSEAESVSDPRVADGWMLIFGGEAGA